MRIGSLFKILELDVANTTELKIALTHSSYGEKSKNNSRYAFLGMFYSKGIVADLLFRYKVGNGMQLQHSLGNTFSQEFLNKLFDQWFLGQYVRFGPEWNPEKHKHIFVYAILGYIIKHYENDVVERFVLKNLITDHTLSEHDPNRFNHRSILDLLSLQYFGSLPMYEVESKLDIHYSTITFKDQYTVLHQSKSKIYAIKKTIEKGIKYVAGLKEALVKEYIEEKGKIIQTIIQDEISKKQEKFILDNELKKKKRQEKAALIKEENKAKEKARLKAKANVKKAKERRNSSKIVITSDMNAAKRRRLEDKLK